MLNVINKNSGSLTDITDVARFNIFSNIFNLNVYNDISSKVKVDLSNVKDEINKYKGRKEQVEFPIEKVFKLLISTR